MVDPEPVLSPALCFQGRDAGEWSPGDREDVAFRNRRSDDHVIILLVIHLYRSRENTYQLSGVIYGYP
jgi:hypothetical protein